MKKKDETAQVRISVSIINQARVLAEKNGTTIRHELEKIWKQKK